MRYSINFDKIINQLVPYYIAGRKLILYLQALISPLQRLNGSFSEYANETRIEASMTSQIFKFEWYLNRKFSKYFLDGGKISISNSEALGSPIYRESANIQDNGNAILRQENESGNTLILYYSNEQTYESSVSFIVATPHVNTALISVDKYTAMLRHCIDKYRLANKTYIIRYE